MEVLDKMESLGLMWNKNIWENNSGSENTIEFIKT